MFSPAAEAVRRKYEERMAAEAETFSAITIDEAIARRDEFLISVGPEAAEFLAVFARAAGATRILELGTSYGYSTLFLAAAAQATGGRVVTIDLVAEKQAYARGMLEEAGLADPVTWRTGDAIELISAEPGPFDFVLLDVWKDGYVPCLKALLPKLADEAIVIADNMIHPEGVRADARAYRAAVAAEPELTSTLLPIGSGLEVSCRWPKGSPKL